MMSNHMLPCIKPFIESTKEGNRNDNVFKALSHIRLSFNHMTKQKLRSVSKVVNEYLEVPLSTSELKQITKSVNKTQYQTSCKHFKKHCRKCKIGYQKTYVDHYGYWKLLNKDNTLKTTNNIIPLDSTYYPWDITDLSTVNTTTRKQIEEFREAKGIKLDIDSFIKRYGIPVGDTALQEYLHYKNEMMIYGVGE